MCSERSIAQAFASRSNRLSNPASPTRFLCSVLRSTIRSSEGCRALYTFVVRLSLIFSMISKLLGVTVPFLQPVLEPSQRDTQFLRRFCPVASHFPQRLLHHS